MNPAAKKAAYDISLALQNLAIVMADGKAKGVEISDQLRSNVARANAAQVSDGDDLADEAVAASSEVVLAIANYCWRLDDINSRAIASGRYGVQTAKPAEPQQQPVPPSPAEVSRQTALAALKKVSSALREMLVDMLAGRTSGGEIDKLIDEGIENSTASARSMPIAQIIGANGMDKAQQVFEGPLRAVQNMCRDYQQAVDKYNARKSVAESN